MSVVSRRMFLATGAAIPVAAWAQSGTYGTIHRLNAALDALIAPDAVIEQVAWGFKWAEGPVWVKNGEYLLLSDPPMNAIYRWTMKDGSQMFLYPSGYAGSRDQGLREPGSNGLAIDASGALVMCDSGSRALARLDLAAKQKQIIVDRYQGKRFNSPNDLCIARSGAIYFTDPPYGLTGIEKSPARELPFSGVYRYGPDGSLALLDKDFLFPNGIALSPDESTLYVSNSDPKLPVIKAFALGPDGMPTSSAMFFDATALIEADTKGMPDGMKVDALGNLFASGPGGIMVLSRTGKLLGLISLTGRTSPNCAFGEDGSSLFIASTDIVARVRLKTHGA